MSSVNGKTYWVPLESSPDAMNKVIRQMGVGASAAFSDVFGFDDELLEMVPQPVHALVFLFPLTDKFEDPRKQEALSSENKVSPNVWFMKQTIGNACGTMAIFHALGNNQKTLPIGNGDLAAFFERVNGLSPEAKAAELEQSSALADAHKSGAAEGQTEAPAADAEVEHHYAAYAIVDGDLYEIDGRLPAPINHGPSTDVLKDGARVIKKRIAAFEGDSQQFSVISLGQEQ
ncbi:Ubiquitin carboxyl-terminal hydrolase isozyme L3 [Coemansia sp. RSA 2399]|nr:Ubiquitin carboxyl-terminal hydrolase isozyme L3 [Coemansia sp. RSA 2399]